MPTLHWEAVREGAKDRRYVATLEQRLAGKQGGRIHNAYTVMSLIAAGVRLAAEDYDPIQGGRIPAAPPGTYDQWRREIRAYIEQIDTLGPDAPGPRRPPASRLQRR